MQLNKGKGGGGGVESSTRSDPASTSRTDCCAKESLPVQMHSGLCCSQL